MSVSEKSASLICTVRRLSLVVPTPVSNVWAASLPAIYLLWVFVVIALYPLCRWYAGVKRRRKDWWLSYL